MKKIMLYIISLIIIIGSYYYIKSNNERIINECINTKEENSIAACLEYHGFTRDVRGFQENYDVFYNHSNFDFLNKKIQYNFVNQYLITLSDCKGTKGCNLKDEGKGYYIALNKCLKNYNCTDQLLEKNEKNCFKNLTDSIEKIPNKFKHLILVDKNKLCEIYKQEN